MKTESLSLHEARARALAAQGFDRERRAANAKALARVVAATELFQIDSVSVVVRAHYLPLFSRLGVYDRRLLDEAAWGAKRSLFEYWAHEASLLPFATQPLFRWRMRRAQLGVGVWKVLADFGRANQRLIADMLARIRDEGAKVAGDFEKRTAKSWFWSWSDAKRGLEWLFWSGKLTTATRRSFERIYDLPERVLPAAILALPTPSDHDAHVELTRRAVRALGVANRREIRDYFRTALADTDPCIAELVEAGEIVPVHVEGLKGPYYVPRAARTPKARDYQALLAPFDPVVWQRQRTHDLFGFHYRLEIYTPAPQRRHGYYVLPFLLGDRLVARVDLKSDRKRNRLQVVAVHAEAGVPPHAAEALAGELGLLAEWLGLATVAVAPGHEPAGHAGPRVGGLGVPGEAVVRARQPVDQGDGFGAEHGAQVDFWLAEARLSEGHALPPGLRACRCVVRTKLAHGLAILPDLGATARPRVALPRARLIGRQ